MYMLAYEGGGSSFEGLGWYRKRELGEIKGSVMFGLKLEKMEMCVHE